MNNEDLILELFTHLESPKKFSPKKIEKWIYESSELESLLANDYYYELIGCNFSQLTFPAFKMNILDNLSQEISEKWLQYQSEQLVKVANSPEVLIIRLHKPDNDLYDPSYSRSYDEYVIDKIIHFQTFKNEEVEKYTNYITNDNAPTVSGTLRRAYYKSIDKVEEIMISENLILSETCNIEKLGKKIALVFTFKLNNKSTHSFHSDITYFSEEDWDRNG